LIVGTPEFMSPEQANSTPVDGRSDVYSLGCIAWLLATGRLPFPQRGLTDLLVAHRNQMPKPPHEMHPSVPRAWSEVIMRSMAKRPEERYQSARAFGEALAKSLRAASPSAPLVPPVAPAQMPAASRSSQASPQRPGQPQPRFTTRFQAVVSMVDGTQFGTLECQDISKGGMFLSTTGELPPVFSRVKVTIPSAQNLGLLAEVVRHVPPDQARAWSMAPGFGVQFVDLTPQLRESIGRLSSGAQVVKAAAPVASSTSVETTLLKWRDRMNGDHYVVLGVAPDTDPLTLRGKGQDALAELKLASERATDAPQRAQVDAALQRVQAALDVLGVPGPRARFDSNRGNWKGVARCILGGLGPLDLERLRQEHLTQHPNSAGAAHVKFLASKGFEANGQLKEALEACEAALQLDPLNLQLHQRHATLARRLKEPARP
jgi:serine/threonine-protein kinase